MADTCQIAPQPTPSPSWSAGTRWQLLGIAMALAALMPLAEWLSWQKSGLRHLGGYLQWLAMFGLAGALLGLPICFIAGCVPRFRRHAGWGLVGLSMVVVSLFAGFSVSLSVRRVVLGQVMARAEPLIEAIRKREAESGRPPQHLAELVPKYLAVVPTPGVGTSPEFYYRRPTSEDDLEGNVWMLDVNPPVIGLGFDRFIYLPKQNYPERGWGGVLERIGTWAYVHE